jgi:uncharacterized protein (TIGR02466 family)
MIETLHAIEIYKTHIDIENLDQLVDPEFLKSLPTGSLHDYLVTSNMVTGYGSWHKIKDGEKLHAWPEFQPMIEAVDQHAKKFWDHLGYWPDLAPKPYQSWINICNRDGQLSSHIHYNVPLSAVVYLDASPEQGNLVFEHPMSALLGFCPIVDKKVRLKHEVQVRTGDIVIFPGYFRHYTLPNNTDRPRITFAINYNETGHFENFNNYTQDNKK